MILSRRFLQTQTTESALTSPILPLKGLKILDLTRVLAGPYCTQILGDYGADVIKVEQPGLGDETRQWRTSGEGAMWKDEVLTSLYFCAVNRNKRSITLNLKSSKGREIVRSLAKDSDVVVNNFLPGTMERLGLDYSSLSKINPRLIYASISGYGASGPSSHRAGYDAIALAEAGLLHITGDPSGPPAKPGVAIADLCTGLYTHGAILAALNHRSATGSGCQIDSSLFESSLALLINVGLATLNLEGKKGARLGLSHPNLVPYGGMKTRDGRYIFIAANNNVQWAKLCRVIAAPPAQLAVDDARFASNDARVAHRAALDAALAEVFQQRTLAEWLDAFDGSGLPYAPINDVAEALLRHPQAEARATVEEIDGFAASRSETLRMIGVPVKFGGAEKTDNAVRRMPPGLGEHTAEVLGELGYREDEVEELRRSAVV